VTGVQKCALQILPTTISVKEIYKRCRKFGDLEKTNYPLEGRNEPVAALLFKTPTDARKAVMKLNRKIVKGKEVSAVLQSKEQHQPSKKSLKKSRLIVRNLSFKCTEAILMEFFSLHGKVTEVNIPCSMKGKRKRKQGFAFVQFLDVFSAAKARQELNLKEILGRPIAVDWALSKEEYEKAEQSKGMTMQHQLVPHQL
jgi:nucleolar protein 4